MVELPVLTLWVFAYDYLGHLGPFDPDSVLSEAGNHLINGRGEEGDNAISPRLSDPSDLRRTLLSTVGPLKFDIEVDRANQTRMLERRPIEPTMPIWRTRLASFSTPGNTLDNPFKSRSIEFKKRSAGTEYIVLADRSLKDLAGGKSLSHLVNRAIIPRKKVDSQVLISRPPRLHLRNAARISLMRLFSSLVSFILQSLAGPILRLRIGLAPSTCKGSHWPSFPSCR